MRKFIFSFAIGLLVSVNSCFADTLTVYASDDGYAYKLTYGSWSTVRAATPTTVSQTDSHAAEVASDGSSNFYTPGRLAFVFSGTSAIGASANIDSVTLNVYAFTGRFCTFSRCDGLSATSWSGVTPSSAGNYVIGNFGSPFYTKTYADYPTSAAYVQFPMNAAGISNINKTGTSYYGVLLAADATNTALPSEASKSESYNLNGSRYSGTSRDPYLTIVTSAAFTPSTIIISDNGKNMLNRYAQKINTYIAEKILIPISYAHE